MEDRRRSERRVVALPVWIKDARGGERTRTADVSAHGISVFTRGPRPPRQYVELEIELPGSEMVIAVTAMVARCGLLVDPTSGQQHQGMGLDFFLFDTTSKSRWQYFLRNHFVAEPAMSPAADVEDDVPAFLVRPRDVDRMWAFFRGELHRAQVRIETAVSKPPGTVVELLVVHPTTQAEWILDGEVLSMGPFRQDGGVVLEIGLPGLDEAFKEAFSGFITTGVGQIQEEVSLSAEVAPEDFEEDPGDDSGERIESVVIDFEALETVDYYEDEEPTAPAPNEVVEAASGAVEPTVSSAEVEVLSEILDPSASIFGSFFAEAAAAQAAAGRGPHGGLPPAELPEVLVADETRPPPPGPPPLPVDERPGPPALPVIRGRALPRADSPEPKTDPATSDPSDAGELLVDRRRIDRTLGIRIEPAADNMAGEPPPPSPSPPAAGVGPVTHGMRLAAVRDAKENLRSSHRNLSTAGSRPGLDRAIAMARARVVRRPGNIAASLELSQLLSARGDHRFVDEAIDVVRKASALAPDQPMAHHRLAELFARKGDYRLAREHLSRAKRLGLSVDPDLERIVSEGIKAG